MCTLLWKGNRPGRTELGMPDETRAGCPSETVIASPGGEPWPGITALEVLLSATRRHSLRQTDQRSILIRRRRQG